MKHFPCCVLIASLALVSGAFADSAKRASREVPKEVDGLPLLFREDFQDGEKTLARFEFLDPTDWKIAWDSDRTVLSLFRKPAAKTPFRSPFGRALVKDLHVGPFVMEVKLKSTVKDYGHRDLCLYFGSLDVSRLYYVHLGKKPDSHCGNVFIVNSADRKALAPVPMKGIDWTDGYHTARLVRGADGAIEVFFDGKSWLKATDRTFPVGQVGVGSFDDTGTFAEITVWGKKAEKTTTARPEGK